MADANDMILPMLREMRAELGGELRSINKRLEAMEAAQKSFKNALVSDTLMSRLLTGEFEQRIEALEEKVQLLEAR